MGLHILLLPAWGVNGEHGRFGVGWRDGEEEGEKGRGGEREDEML